LASPDTDLNKLHDAAKKEGRVTYYASSSPSVSEKIIDKFQTTYPGVSVDLLRLSTGPLGKRFETEASSGIYVADVLQLADPLVVENATEKKWLASMADLPAHQEFPSAFKGDTYAVVRIDPHTVTYNTQIVKASESPQAWTDLTDPKWKGKILAPDLRISLMLVNWALLMMETYGSSYLETLGKQDIRWVPSQIPGSQQLAAGEASLLFPNQKQVTEPFIEKGAPIVDNILPPQAGHEGVLTVPAKAPHPNGARLLANFIMSRTGAAILNSGVSYSPLKDIPGALVMPASFKRANLRESFKRQNEIMELIRLK
jgi:iron(III) transport system substrate-binding protein